ncbi:MAG: ABC transporter ATP-binding protein [Fidelibacterota bacterium]
MIEVQQVTKDFHTVRALDQVSFRIQKGDVYGLLGPNGAGKTTLIRTLMGILKPDQGQILLQGRDISNVPRYFLGYLPEERGLYQKSKLAETLVYLGHLKGKPSAQLKPLVQQWLERFELQSYSNRKIEELSKGNQQKVQFIAALLHEPEVVVLDEPFSGLDPLNQVLMKEIIRELQTKGVTFLFSTHQMDQVEKLCTNICLLNKGRVLVEGPLTMIRQRHTEKMVEVHFEGVLQTTEVAPYLEGGKIKDGLLRGHLKGSPHDLLNWLNQRVVIQSFEVAQPSLEQIFIEEVKSA